MERAIDSARLGHFRQLAEELSGDWYAELGADLRVAWFHAPTAMKFGIQLESWVGRKFNEIENLRFEVIDGTTRDLLRHLEHKSPFVGLRCRIAHGDDELHMAISGRPVFGEAAAFMGFRVIGRDISTEVRLQRELRAMESAFEVRVAERGAELERTVADLGVFAQTLAHDLASPLRGIQSFLSIVLDDRNSRMSDAGRALVSRAVQSAGSMQALIDGVLSYSLAGHREPARVEVEVASVIEELLPGLSRQYPMVRFEMEPLGSLFADPVMLRQILLNLLGNAFKYSAQAAAPQVKASSLNVDGNAWIAVRDNGFGFDVRELGRLVRPFERGDSGASAGTGLGLSIVDRLVRRHAGQWLVKSSPHSGTEVRFCLSPQARADVFRGFTHPE